jgi:hypothetical protein
MNAVIFYCAGGTMFAVGSLMMRNTERYHSEGGSSFERMQTRRLLGIIVLIAATMLLGLGLLTQFD